MGIVVNYLDSSFLDRDPQNLKKTIIYEDR